MLPGFDPAPATAPKYHHFDFTVTGLTAAQASALSQFIQDELEYYGAVVEAGGGMAEVTADGEAVGLAATAQTCLFGDCNEPCVAASNFCHAHRILVQNSMS